MCKNTTLYEHQKKSEPCCGVVPIFCCEMTCFDGFIAIIQIQVYM